MKDLGPLHFLLGIQVLCTEANLHLSQAKYITDILEKCKIIRAKPAKTPLPTSAKLSHSNGDPLDNVTAYRQSVRSLQYCSVTWILFMHKPTTIHWTAAKRVLHYLKGTLTHGLLFGCGTLNLIAYSDFDWAGNPDDCCSTIGYPVFLNPW